MELQELVNLWGRQDQKLESQLKLNRRLLKTVSMDKVKSLLSEFTLSNILELVINGVFFWFLMHFVLGQWPAIKFVLPGIVLLLFTLISILWNLYKLLSLAAISYESSVVEVQKRLQRLQFYQRLDRNSLYVLIPVFSLITPIWFLWAFLGLDPFNILGNWWVYHLIGTLIIAAIIVWALKKFPDKKMAKAIGFLEEIKKFEKEG